MYMYHLYWCPVRIKTEKFLMKPKLIKIDRKTCADPEHFSWGGGPKDN